MDYMKRVFKKSYVQHISFYAVILVAPLAIILNFVTIFCDISMATVFFVTYTTILILSIIMYIHYMHLLDHACTGIPNDLLKNYALFIADNEDDYYIMDEFVVFASYVGLVPIRYDEIKKIIVRRWKKKATIKYVLKKPVWTIGEAIDREKYLVPLLSIKSRAENITVTYKGRK